jgi:hypothetical protein
MLVLLVPGVGMGAGGEAVATGVAALPLVGVGQ